MKVNELMIGDWVLTLDSTHKEKVFTQVDAIEEGKHSILVTRGCSNWFVDIDWIEPIPLTPEILEKNGFINDKGIFVYEDETKVVTFFSKENNRPYCNYPFINIDCGCVTLNELPIEYVHELQHALRLCRIKKKIEL